MPTRKSTPAKTRLAFPAKHRGKSQATNRKRVRVSHAWLEQRRKELLQRTELLLPTVKANKGFKSVRALLGSRYVRASLTARLSLLQAADFLVTVLEMMPP